MKRGNILKSNSLKKEKEKAITLIALVITIIVLLILAGVTVATITGENGLLSKAQLAKEKNIEAEQDEKDKLSSYENELDNYSTMPRTGGTVTITEDELWSGLATENKTYNFSDSNKKASDYNYILVLCSDKNGSDNQSMLVHKSQVAISSSTNLIQLTGYDTRFTTFYFNENSFTIMHTDGTYMCINKIIGIN